MQLLLGQPLQVSPHVKVEQKMVMHRTYQVLQGKRFTYYVKTNQSGIITEVTAKSTNMLAPVSYFIQNPQSCTKKLIVRDPLRFAKYEYDCNGVVYHYTTFGMPGFLTTTARIVK